MTQLICLQIYFIQMHVLANSGKYPIAYGRIFAQSRPLVDQQSHKIAANILQTSTIGHQN